MRSVSLRRDGWLLPAVFVSLALVPVGAQGQAGAPPPVGAPGAAVKTPVAGQAQGSSSSGSAPPASARPTPPPNPPPSTLAPLGGLPPPGVEESFPAPVLPSQPPPNVPPPPPSVMRFQRTVAELQVQVLVMAQPEDGEKVRAIVDDSLAEVGRILALATPPDGAVERINRDAGIGPVGLPPELMDMLSESLRICTLSGGAYDPTAAAYEGLWPFESGGPLQSPPPEELARRSTLVDCKQLKIDTAARTAFLQKAGMKLSVRDAARGVALDRAMDMLRTRGLGDAILYVGGDAVVSGHKAGRRWMVGIQDPRGTGHFAAFPVPNGAVFTVGDYEQSFIERGRRMHSVLDPKTGLPARGVRSATVHARTAAEAALLSRAIFVLGVDNGMRLIERLPQVEAVMVDDRNRVWVSKGLSSTLKYRPPTDSN